jgi:hypothetical protein
MYADYLLWYGQKSNFASLSKFHSLSGITGGESEYIAGV